MSWSLNTQPLRARWLSATTAAFRQFESNKSRAFTCSIFQLYANDAPSVEWRGFLAACFGVHFFAGNSIVNSPLHCWALDAERERLWKSLCARVNTLFTVARRACAITGSHFIRFVENILLLSRELRGKRPPSRRRLAEGHVDLSFAHQSS